MGKRNLNAGKHNFILFQKISVAQVVALVVAKNKVQKQKALDNEHVTKGFADWTGLEPATSAVTGRHSNRLNYQSLLLKRCKYTGMEFIPPNIFFNFFHFF